MLYRFYDGDRHLGAVSFVVCAWYWQPEEGKGHVIDVLDREAEEALMSQRQSIARQDESVRPALEAEWQGRVNIYRDETADMAVIYGRVQSRKL